MKFIVDNQLPIALSRFLASEGLEACHVMDVELDEASDHEIWEYAKMHGYTIVSKDEDFFQLANLSPDSTPALIWVRIGNCRKAILISAFKKILPNLLQILQTQQIVEIR
jgi:predicted nuclease of predicted toxin-antitoxin system